MSDPEPSGESGGFTVSLDNFHGPFDLLLQLITRRKLDITEVALSEVTVEFIAHVQALGPDADLDQTTSFLLVAATLVDLKTASLLPQGEVEDPEDLALLEARDLLFARLLQYRAFAIVAGWLGDNLGAQALRHARPGGLEEQFARLLPEPEIGLSPDQLVRLAATALTPRDVPQVPLEHLHLPRVSVREQAEAVVAALREHGTLSFAALTDGCDRLTTIARFLALLELYRERAVALEQPVPLGPLQITWTGEDDAGYAAVDEFEGSTDG